MHTQRALAFIGGGNMAEAIARGLISARVLDPQQMIVSDPAPTRRDLFQMRLQIEAVSDNLTVVDEAPTILLAVKPQQMQQVLQDIAGHVRSEHLLISIAAGISTGFIEKALGGNRPVRVIRSMPNTPMLVGAGAVAIAPGRNANADDMQTARRLFESSAVVVEATEEQMNAVTAVSGSGPAYFFFVVEQLIKTGVELGLTFEQARLLASRTCLGAGQMLADGSDLPEELRARVTSPGGTTQAAITHLQQRNWDTILGEAVAAAARRSAELGR